MTEKIHAFVDEQDIKEIQAPFFKDGEVVTIKKFSYADRQILSGEYTRLSAEWDEEKRDEKGSRRGGRRGSKAKRSAKVKSEIIVGKMNLSILDKGIKSWTLLTRDGKKEVPFSRKNVRKLTDEYAEFILEGINDFNPTREDDSDEDDDFFQSADSGSEGDE